MNSTKAYNAKKKKKGGHKSVSILTREVVKREDRILTKRTMQEGKTQTNTSSRILNQEKKKRKRENVHS